MDVSLGGMRISLAADIKAGARLSGQFKIMPNSGNFYVSAEVIWSKPLDKEAQEKGYQLGIKFNQVSTIPEA